MIWTAPPAVSFESHQATAVDVRDTPNGLQEVVLSTGETIGDLQAVVLALGHMPHHLGESEAALSQFADRHGLRYIPPSNPADVSLDAIPAGESVILRGLGLNFFDYMALFTIGRGGTFVRESDGTLTYLPSGREPRLVAGSRRGVPYHARGKNQKGSFGRHEPRYVTAEVIERLRARADAGAPADFRRDIWPMIDQEVRTVYYATLVRERRCTCDAEEFTAMFATAEPAMVPIFGDPLAIEESDAQRNVLAKFDIDPDQGWDWRKIAAPFTDDDVSSTQRFRSWLRSYLDVEVHEADKGNVTGPRKAALDVLRDLRNEIRLLVDHGGLSGDSYRDELQRWYMPLNAHLSIGPPAERIEQFGALMDAGVLEVLGPDMRVDCSDGRLRRVLRSLSGPHRAGRHADRGAPAGNRPAPDDRPAAADAAGPGRVPAVPHPDPRRWSLRRRRCRGHPASVPAARRCGSPAPAALRVRRAHRVGALGDRGGHPSRRQLRDPR